MVTLELTFLLLALGLVVGIPLALGQVYGGRGVVIFSSIYEQIFRSIPALVLLFLFFFGLSMLVVKFSAFFSAILPLGLLSFASHSQIFRGAIQSIKKGQMVAARSVGMSKLQAIRHVILPQALRLSIPSWSNEYSIVVKDTSLAYAVGVIELLREGRYIIVRTFEPMLIYITIALIYLVLTYTGTKLLGYLEERFRIPGFVTEQGER